MNKRYKLILLDFDGTLADTDEVLVQTMYVLYDKYNGGVRKSREEIKYFSGPPIDQTMAKEFPLYDRLKLLAEFNKIAIDMYPKYMKLYSGCKECLKRLKLGGYKIGLVTNKLHEPTILCLELLEVNHLFDVCIGYDDVNIGKPSGEGILKAMSLLNITNREDVLYVGDNYTDFLSAKDAGVDCALATWSPREYNEDCKPTFYINSYKELEEKLVNENI